MKAIQERKGSRRAYVRMEQSGGFRTEIDEELGAFIADQTSFFLATANAVGQPYTSSTAAEAPGGSRGVREEAARR